MIDNEPQPTGLRAGNTTQTLGWDSHNYVAQGGPIYPTDTPPLAAPFIDPITPKKPLVPPPTGNPAPEFEDRNLGQDGPGSIDGLKPEEPWWKGAPIEVSDKIDPTSLMGHLLDRIERLEDWREHWDERVTRYNRGAQHRI